MKVLNYTGLQNLWTNIKNYITVHTPTKTSDLTNDSNFVDTSNSAVASGITSAKVTDYDTHIADIDKHVTTADKTKWNNGVSQAYVVRYASVAVSDNSTVPYTDLNNTDNIKANDLLLDTNGKFYQITSVDTSTETVSVTTPLTQLAVNSFVIHNTGNETKSGELTLNDTLNTSNIIPKSNNTYDYGTVSNLLKNLYAYHALFRGQQQGDEYSPNARTNLTLLSNRDTIGQSGCLIDKFRENTSQGTGNHILGFGIKENSVRYEGCRFSWIYDNDNNGYVFALRPTMQGTNQPIKYELGNSSSKWSTINGINPGALSLPDLNNGIDISGYLTNAGTTTPSEYTPTVNGWLVLKVGAASGVVSMRAYSNSGLDNYVYSERSDICDTTGSSYVRFVSMTIPCVANDKVKIIIMPSTASVVSAIFYPCLGNV